jgi:hypothetical protein
MEDFARGGARQGFVEFSSNGDGDVGLRVGWKIHGMVLPLRGGRIRQKQGEVLW